MDPSTDSTQPEEAEGDYGYDQAHDMDMGSVGSAPEQTEPVEVATETSDDGQDYSYDLAHDVPGR